MGNLLANSEDPSKQFPSAGGVAIRARDGENGTGSLICWQQSTCRVQAMDLVTNCNVLYLSRERFNLFEW